MKQVMFNNTELLGHVKHAVVKKKRYSYYSKTGDKTFMTQNNLFKKNLQNVAKLAPMARGGVTTWT